ncbi:hypothetical protein CJF32_00006421 [Rutstroemia sp. NJR-2017a WRK4]|nr:hypothetical protein CJF32_00006421 [Rutstroemia sp. NJR-2017a WRK4]
MPTPNIYRALPSYPSTPQRRTAIVTGASGISGQYMLRHLASYPERWEKVWALSRGRPGVLDSLQGKEGKVSIEHVAVDFLAGKDEIAKVLRENGISADTVFFFAYMEVKGEEGEEDEGMWGAQGKMLEVNGKMLKDFILAMEDRPFERIVLQTGAKSHLINCPELRPSSRTQPSPLSRRRSTCFDHPEFLLCYLSAHEGIRIMVEAFDVVGIAYFPVLTTNNFTYYRQEDILSELAPKQNFTYSITRPSHILGAAKGNYMNLAIALGLYFVVQKELGEPAIFPGTEHKYHSFETFSGAALNSHLAEFCALTPECAGEAFNALNGDTTTWARIYPALASYWSATLPPPSTHFSDPSPRPFTLVLDTPAPYPSHQKSELNLRNSLQAWAAEPKVVEAWERIAQREGLDTEVFAKASWGFADAALALGWGVVLGGNKLRKFGFHATVDSYDDWVRVWEEAQELGFLPKVGSGSK